MNYRAYVYFDKVETSASHYLSIDTIELDVYGKGNTTESVSNEVHTFIKASYPDRTINRISIFPR